MPSHLAIRSVLVALVWTAASMVGDSRAASGDESPAADKISPVIRYHRALKRPIEGETEPQRRSRLLRAGIDSRQADAERCALYVAAPLTELELERLRAEKVAEVTPDSWVPPVPGRHAHGFYRAWIPYEALERIDADPRVVRLVSLERTEPPNANLSRTLTGADRVQSGDGVPPRDGAGVKLSIADSGVDLGHPDLPPPVEAFDVTDGDGPGTWGADVSNTVSAHGTHVAGIAVGNGSASAGNVGNGGGHYGGFAPGAAFHFYKIGNDTNAAASHDDMIEAIVRAQDVGVRVHGMSYGGWGTSFLDGSSPVCQTVDAAADAGTTVVFSAGNQAHLGYHASRRVPPASSSPAFRYLIGNATSETPYTAPVQLRAIWRDATAGDANVDVQIDNLGAGESFFEQIHETSVRGTESKLFVLLPAVPAGVNKDYELRVVNDAADGPAPEVHLYRVGGKGAFREPDPATTVVHPALCDRALDIGAWTQRSLWINYLNEEWTCCNLATDRLAPFSGRGPRLDGMRKPQFVAPGAATIATRDTAFHTLATRIIDDDGFGLDGSGPASYYADQGTSMAAPAVTGAVALILDAEPNLTPDGVRNALRIHGSRAASPDAAEGFGLIDVHAAIANMPPPAGDTDGDYIAAPAAGGTDCDDGNPSVWATPGEVPLLRFHDPVQLAWDAPAEFGAARRGVSYDVIRSADPADFVGPSAVCVGARPDAAPVAYDAATPPLGETWFYLVGAENGCPNPRGSLGSGSDQVERPARECL